MRQGRHLVRAAPAGEVALQGQQVQALAGLHARLLGLHLQAVHQHLQLLAPPVDRLLVRVQLHAQQRVAPQPPPQPGAQHRGAQQNMLRARGSNPGPRMQWPQQACCTPVWLGAKLASSPESPNKHLVGDQAAPGDPALSPGAGGLGDVLPHGGGLAPGALGEGGVVGEELVLDHGAASRAHAVRRRAHGLPEAAGGPSQGARARPNLTPPASLYSKSVPPQHLQAAMVAGRKSWSRGQAPATAGATRSWRSLTTIF